MDARDRTRELAQDAGMKPVEEDDPLEKLRDRAGRSGPFPHEDPPPAELQDVVQNRELEPSVDVARPGNIQRDRSDHEGPFPDHGRSDEETGRPVQLGGKRPEPTTVTRRT